MRAILSIVAAAAAGCAAAQPASDLDTWLARAAAAEARFDAACAALSAPPAGRVWLQGGAAGLVASPAGPEAVAAAAWWSAAALGAAALAEALYGAADPAALEAFLVEVAADGGAVASFDGRAMASGDACGALRRLATALGGHEEGGDRVAGDGRIAPGGAAAPAAAVPAGGTATVALGALDIDGPVVLRAPDGVEAELTGVDGEGEPTATLRAAPGAPPGPGALRIYAADDPFRPRAVLPLRVLPGAAPAPDAPVAPLAPGGVSRGMLAPRQEATIDLRLDAAATVTLRSLGVADLRATLETAAGVTLAANDDAAGGYGFAIRARLEAGDYRLRVSHCCGGGGRFVVAAEQQ